jgi:hypothetical protein
MTATTSENHRTRRRLEQFIVALITVLAITACDRTPVTRPSGANDSPGPPVNVPRPNPIVKPSNEVNVPLTNVPVTTTTNKGK